VENPLLKSLGIAFLSLWLCLPVSAFGAAPSPLSAEDSPGVPASAPGTSLDEQVERGRALMLQGRFGEARSVLESVLRDDPANAEARRWLARIALREGRIADGIEALELALSLAPRSELWLELGEAYELADRHADAERVYREVLSLDEHNVEAWLRLGQVLDRLGRIDDATAAFERVRAEPSAPPAHVQAATDALDRLYPQRVDAWIADLEHGAVEVGPTLRFGDTLANRLRLAEAQRLFEAVVRIAPDNAIARYWLGRVLVMQRQFDEGLEQFERSIALAPDNLRLKSELGRSYELAGRVADARRVFVEVLEDTEEEAVARDARRRIALIDAREAFLAGELETALSIYRPLLDATPGDPRLLELTATVLEDLGRHDESDRLFGIMLEQRPEDPGLRMRLAATYERRNDTERSQAFYADVVRLQPDSELATLALERLGLARAADLLQTDRADEALLIFERIAALVPESQVVMLGRAMALHRLGRHDEAERAYREVLEAAPDAEIAWLELGQLYQETGRIDDAIDAFERVEAFAVTEQQLQLTAALLNPLYARKHEALVEALERGDADVGDVIDLAESLVRRGFNQDAARMLRMAVDDAPDNPQIYRWLGFAEIGLGETERGLVQIERGAQLAPGDLSLLQELARTYEQTGRLEDAERVWLEIVRRSRDDDVQAAAERSLTLARARRLEQTGDEAGALAEYGRLLARYPEDIGLRLGQGRLLLALDRADEAEEAFADALARAPDNIALYLQIAQIYRGAGMPERAEHMYREAITMNPAHVPARLALGRFYQDSERYDDAFDEFDEALGLAAGTAQEEQVRVVLNNLWGGLIDRGRRQLAAGADGDAEATFRLLLERRPDNAQAGFWLSEVYRVRGDYARQAELLAGTLDEGEPNLILMRRVAIAYDNADLLDDAETMLEEVIQAFPFDSEIRARLASVYQRKGEPARAREEYVRLLELSPTVEWRIRALDRLGLEEARAQRERREFAPALASARRVLADVPEDSLVHLEIARIHDQAGQTAEAEEAYRTVLRLDPADQEARIGLARVYAATGRDGDAIAAYAGIASARPPTARTEAAREELDALLLRRARERIEAAERLERTAAREALMAPGIEAFDLESYDAAKEIFEHLVRIAPEDAEAHYRLGRVFEERQAYADAAIFLKRSTDLEPANPRYQIALGRVYKESRLDLLAEQALAEAVELEPDNPVPRFELADLYERRGDEVRAQAQLAAVLQLATDRESVSRALNKLGLSEDPDRLDQAGLELAARIFEQSMTEAPRALQVRLYIAIVDHRLLRLEQAEAGYREVLSTDPAQVQAALRMAQLFGQTGRVDDAIALYERIATRATDPRLAALARQQQTGLYVRKAEQLAGQLERGEGDLAEARRLGPILVERGAHDVAAPMLEAATRLSPRDPQLWYFLGRAHADRGRFEAGLAALERSDQLFPGNLLLRHHLAISYGRSGQPDKAIPIFEELSRQDDDPNIRREARISLGLLRAARFDEVGDHEGALAEYDALLALAPEDVTMIGERARLLAELGRDDEADAALRRILEIAPDNLGIRLRLAFVYRDRGDNPGFLEQLSAIIDLGPRSPESLQARTLLGFDDAMERFEAGDHDGAAEIFERVMAAVPHDPLTRYHLGDTYFQQRRFAEAEAMLTEVIRIMPDFQLAHLTLGRLYETLERPDSAIRAYERVLALGRNTPTGREAQPLLAALYAQRVQDLFSEGRDEEALIGLVKLLESDPGNIAARTTLASLHSQAGRHEDALHELEIAVRLQPDNPRTYAQLGTVYTSLARDMRAAEAHAWSVSLETDRQRAEAQVRELVMAVSRHMITQDQPFAAIRHLRALNDQGLGNERTYFMLAALYRQQGRFDEATRAFRDAVRFAPDNISLRFSLAELYERGNDLDLALIQYRQIVRVGEPGSLIVEESRRRAASLRNRLALFTSQMSYSMTVGESNIEEQDLTGTGALNTRFSSQLFYNLSTNYRPTPSASLRLDTGLAYVSNHSTERDTIVPRLGLSGNLNFPSHFYGASVHASDIRELVSDREQGRTYNASISGGLRFTNFRDLLPGWWRKRAPEHGEDAIERAPVIRPVAAPETENPRLRRALDEALRRQPALRDPVLTGEGVRKHDVRAEDTLADIAAALGFDARRWEEEWRDDPRIVDPALLLPGDTVVLFQDADGMAIVIESRGDGMRLGTQLEMLAPEQRLEREVRIRAAVDEGMARYRGGVDLLRQGRYAEAQSRFEQILAIVPRDPLTLLHLGIALERQGRVAEAEEIWQRALDADPSLQQARLRLVEMYLTIRDLAAAAGMIAEFAARRAAGEAADQAVTLGQRIADAGMTDVIMDLPEPPAGAVALPLGVAETLLALDDPAAARTVIESLIEAWPFSARANYLLAGILHRKGSLPEAVPHAELAIELDPDNAEYRLLLARIHRDAGEYDAADAVYRQALELSGDAALRDRIRLEAGLARAEGLEAAGETGQALAGYSGLLDEHPGEVEVLAAAANAAAELGRFDEAAAYLREAVAGEPDSFDLQLRLADIYLRQGRTAAAEEALSAALDLASDAAQRREVLDRLGFEDGLEQIRNGRWRRALATMERIQVVAPDDPLVRLNVGVVRQQQRRPLDAESTFQQLLDEDPRNLTARLRLGLLYSETDRVDRAITLLERVASEGRGQSAGERASEALEGLESRRLRRLVGDEVERGTPSLKTLQLRGFYTDTELPARSLTETYTYGVGLTFFYRSLRAGDWILNYTFGTRENEDPLGTDYAYVWNDFGVTWRSSVPNPWGWFGPSDKIPGLTGTLSLSREMRLYTFADTNALNALGQAIRREHNTDSVTLGLNYQPPNHDKINLFLNYNYGRSRSNLPVGIVFSPDGIPIAFQSRGLGDFDPRFISMGLSFQF
jgi:tetratricopeptide (TPR) repeat protein